MVITRDGKLAAWGENGSQECEVPNDQIGSASVVQVWSGGENYALLDDGRLLHWGRQLRGKAFPPELSEIDAVFSGYPAAVIVRDTEGNISISGAAQSRPVFLKELKNWEDVIVGPQFIYGISE
ncbi:MAG: hypothetical protein KDN20_24455 [Verrucomicrobiae bacterium]|nr:hypothetical protein [Verrucomicrobiae bacterium]